MMEGTTIPRSRIKSVLMTQIWEKPRNSSVTRKRPTSNCSMIYFRREPDNLYWCTRYQRGSCAESIRWIILHTLVPLGSSGPLRCPLCSGQYTWENRKGVPIWSYGRSCHCWSGFQSIQTRTKGLSNFGSYLDDVQDFSWFPVHGRPTWGMVLQEHEDAFVSYRHLQFCGSLHLHGHLFLSSSSRFALLLWADKNLQWIQAPESSR